MLFRSADQRALDDQTRNKTVYTKLDEVLAAVRPAVRVEDSQPVRVLMRAKPGSAAVHLLNYAYDAARDDVTPLADVRIKVNTQALGVEDEAVCWFHEPGSERRQVAMVDDTITVPALHLWGILEIGKRQP